MPFAQVAQNPASRSAESHADISLEDGTSTAMNNNGSNACDASHHSWRGTGAGSMSLQRSPTP